MGAALALAERGRGLTCPNPNVGCVIVSAGRVVGRGWTQAGGRPHAEAMALGEAGSRAQGATAYVTLEPCARPGRGPACADGLVAAGVRRVVAAAGDPFPAVDGQGFARLQAAGVEVVEGVRKSEAERAMAGFLTRQRAGRPHVTLKLALSLDGCLALASGASRWITGPAARAHAHLERAKSDAILIGRGTWEADQPKLDVRLPGLERREPARYVLGSRNIEGFSTLAAPQAIAGLPHNTLLVEGGATVAASFLRADLVDRLMLYTAPIMLGGKRGVADLGLTDLAATHARWRLWDERRLGADRLQVYERTR